MENEISPKYLMRLVSQVEKAIWNEYSSYKNVRLYIEKWHRMDDYWENFPIILKSQSLDIDLTSTLHKIDGELLLKIAIDLGVETPDFIPCIPTFKNELKITYNTAFNSFQKAFKQVEEHPDVAVGLANSTLESIIKKILQDTRLKTKYDRKKTLYSLTADVLKEFRLFPNDAIPEEVRNIGSALMNISKNIEDLRSDKTNLHGKTSDDYVVNNPMYAYFVINSIATVGMFISSFYKLKFPEDVKPTNQSEPVDDLPF